MIMPGDDNSQAASRRTSSRVSIGFSVGVEVARHCRRWLVGNPGTSRSASPTSPARSYARSMAIASSQGLRDALPRGAIRNSLSRSQALNSAFAASVTSLNRLAGSRAGSIASMSEGHGMNDAIRGQGVLAS